MSLKILFQISLLAIFTLLITNTSIAGRRCTGSANCTACKNCNGCQYCNEGGGTCGVCSYGDNSEDDETKYIYSPSQSATSEEVTSSETESNVDNNHEYMNEKSTEPEPNDSGINWFYWIIGIVGFFVLLGITGYKK